MSRLVMAFPAVVMLALVAGGTVAASPPGATARCVDGTYSYSQHHSGTCSHHGGVAAWLGGGSSAPSSHGSPVGRFGATVLLGARTRTSGCARGRCRTGAARRART